MKICVYFQPKLKFDNFEGTRLRKSIKGALELRNIPYAKNIVDSYNIIHFCSLEDETKILDAYEAKIPTVFSAYSAEADKFTRIYHLVNGVNTIDNRALRVLNKVDVILVNEFGAKELLQSSGITSRIEVVPLGVKTSRFRPMYGIEDKLFNHYFQLDDDAKIIIAGGTYEDKDKFESLIKIASLCPKYRFFYFGPSTKRKPYKNRKIPSNLSFHPLINDELYCSMMKQASVYLAFDNRRHTPLPLMDAAASKTQIVALEPALANEEILKSLGAYIVYNEEMAADTIAQLIEGHLESHIKEAYKIATNNSLEAFGLSLEKIYDSLLKEK